MKKTAIILFVLFFTSFKLMSFAQSNDDDIFKSTFFTGGNLGLQFGNVVLVDVSPQFGYYPMERIAIGAGLTYQYIGDYRYTPPAKINVYGGRVFTRLYIPYIECIFGHLEHEIIYYRTDIFNVTGEPEWIFLGNYMVGAGYRQIIGERSSSNIMVLWNLNESVYSLYSNPVIRFGIDIDLGKLNKKRK